MELGSKLSAKGFFTRQINIQGQTLAEIESRLGFHKGRLSQGAYFLVAKQLPKEGDFKFAGYSQVASHKTIQAYGDINNDKGLERTKPSVMSQWSVSGNNRGQDRLVKVIPVIQHNKEKGDDEQYPPGSGIQQWQLSNEIEFVVECFVADYPNGRYKPKEGFTEVKYK